MGEMDKVNTTSATNMEAMLASKFKQDKQMTRILKQQAKDEAEETAELKKVAAMDVVNEEAKENLENKLADKMTAQKQHAKDEAEEEAELKEVAAADNVNEEAKENLAAKLADKMAAQKQHAMDEKEEEAELKEVAAADNVNEESKAKLEEQLEKVKEKKAEEVAEN